MWLTKKKAANYQQDRFVAFLLILTLYPHTQLNSGLEDNHHFPGVAS